MRVKRGKNKKKRHKKYLKEAKGYSHAKSKRYKNARNQVEKSWQYSTRDRKTKKREMRKLWITRINAACRQRDMSYSKFIHGLKEAEVEIDRRMMQQIAMDDPEAFSELVKLSKNSQ
ncbi:MAG: 50S ribosomal protein L20 [Elusimicrobiota bacterium]